MKPQVAMDTVYTQCKKIKEKFWAGKYEGRTANLLLSRTWRDQLQRFRANFEVGILWDKRFSYGPAQFNTIIDVPVLYCAHCHSSFLQFFDISANSDVLFAVLCREDPPKKKKEKKKAVAWFWMHRHRVTCSVYFASEQPSTNRLCVSVGAHSGGKRSHVPGNSGWFAFLFAFAFFNRLVVIGLTFLFARLSHWRGLWDVLRYWFHHQNALQCGIWFNTRDKSSVFYWLDDDKKQVSCCVMVRHQTSFLRLSGWVTLDMWNVPSTSYCVCMVTLQELDCSVAVLFSLSSSTRHSVFCAVFIAICLDRTRCDIVTLWWFCWTWICWSAEPTVDAKIFMFFVCRGSACQ